MSLELRLAAHPPGDEGGEGDAGGGGDVLGEGEAPGAAVAAGVGLLPGAVVPAGVGLLPGAVVPAGDGTVIAAGEVMPPAAMTEGLEPAAEEWAGA